MDTKDVKILCTAGPASSELKVLKRMKQVGMNAVRVNTAHGTFSDYKKILSKVRKLDLPVVLDIKGPDLRIYADPKVSVKRGELVQIDFQKSKRPYLNYNISKSIKKGDVLLVEDGKYRFIVEKITAKSLFARAKLQACIEKNKNANVPNVSLNLPSLTKKDLEAIRFAKKEEIEYIALSFCRNKEDVVHLRKRLGQTKTRIIAKIENKEGVENITEIIRIADGIMVARGDLGVELPAQRVPLIQKAIIEECYEQGKIVIVATQMLDSMITNPTPTRAEISDIANAVLDGADCLMLSAESAVGKYPIQAISTMASVIKEVEPEIKVSISAFPSKHISESISQSVAALVKAVPITKIVCLTHTGYTAQKISRFRLDLPIFAITNEPLLKRQLMLHYAIKPVLFHRYLKEESLLRITKHLLKEKIIDKKDIVLFTGGLFSVKGGITNMISVHHVSELMKFVKLR